MKKQNGIFIAVILVFVVLSVIFVACDDDGSKEATRKAREIAQKSEYYFSLDENEKKEFDDELNEIIDSEYFKSLDENGKSELVGKFVESEKTIKELANDPKDKNPEDLDETTATQQEIKYWEIVKTVKETIENNLTFRIENPDTTVRRVNGIYVYQGGFYFNADIINEDIIDGKAYFSQKNVFCRSGGIATGEEEYDELIYLISKNSIYQIDKTCINKNSEEQTERFDEVKKDVSSLVALENLDYTIDIIESWNTTEHSYPEYIVRARSEKNERWYMVTYEPNLNKYRRQSIQRICPEFWAQLEIERAKNNGNV